MNNVRCAPPLRPGYRRAAAVAIAVVVLATGCASTPGEPGDAPPLDMMTILAQTETSDYDEPEKCLSRFDYRHTRVLNDRYIAFVGSGDSRWVNELRTRCIGLRRDDALRLERTSGQLCAMDTVRGIDGPFGPFSDMGPSCTLGDFHRVTEAQLQVLQDALR